MKDLYVWFIWLFLNLIVFGVGSYPFLMNINEYAWHVLGIALYFVLFFVSPLFRRQPLTLTALFCMKIIIITATYYSIIEGPYGLVVFLMLVLVVAEAAEQLGREYFITVGLTGIISATYMWFSGSFSLAETLLSFLLILLSGLGLAYFHVLRREQLALTESYQSLLQEFRELSRRLRDEEELVRQEERQMIGQEIHDSVGHNLTSLVMQFEALRLKSDVADESQILQLKNLALSSLEETRRAVKTFRKQEVGGLQGVIRLIRKLELENFIRISFLVKNGAFAAPLSGEQSFAIYRAVQEGLTNLMKHSQAREAKITFDAPGGSIFRFELENPVKDPSPYKEGYGLTSMRERLEKFGGGIETHKNNKTFFLRGWIRLNERGETDDTHLTR